MSPPPSLERTWLPELDADWPDEAASAPCDRCPLARAAHEPPTPDRPFTARVRCCGRHPDVPAHLVGRMLRDGGEGAERVRARLARGGGVEPQGLVGRGERRCPLLGEGGCAVHAHRPAACRTWWCASDLGARGLQAWTELGLALSIVETALARACCRDGAPPVAGASPLAWEDWFRWCADHVDTLELPPPPELAPLRHRVASALRTAATLPDVLGPTAPPFEIDGDTVVFAVPGRARARYPRAVFALLAALDGRPWRDALPDGLTEADVRDLYGAGVIGPPQPVKLEPMPGPVGLTTPDGTPARDHRLATEPAAEVCDVHPRLRRRTGRGVQLADLHDTVLARVVPDDLDAWRPLVLAAIQRHRALGAFDARRDVEEWFSPDNPDFHRPFRSLRWTQDTLLDTGHVVHTWTDPGMDRLFGWLVRAAAAVSAELGEPDEGLTLDTLWCHITGVGGEMRLHSHGGRSWEPVRAVAVIAYLQLDPPGPEAPDSGAVSWVDDAWDSAWLHHPVEGEILAVPTHLRHRILPYTGRRDRIVVAGNVSLPRRQR